MSAPLIHPTAIISPQAVLGQGTSVGPYCVIEGNAVLGDHCILHGHVTIGPHTTAGDANVFFPYVTIGLEPQDLKFSGEITHCIIGKGNIFREGVTVNRGTEKGGSFTRLGDDNFLMTGAHVAHDCQVGDKNIFANHATLAGHVEVGSECNIGAFSAVHQFCRVGDHAFLGGFTVATLDCLPYMKTVGTRDTKSYGVNSIGLERKGFASATILALKKSHRTLFQSDFEREEALRVLRDEFSSLREVLYLLKFIEESPRGVHRG